ncbi:alpha/beta hydrolase [Rhodococcus sp. HNM0569]|uniref:alpha/beta hydrolase n=1 Tax=Rhodococcus sp. HNM0569 TaxID=2716340 RepID=UPI00146CB829|nr:alpha/beta hydrolase [Rhodococcus sp. HNM0569]NLU84622.1 alpha/beta hydrolase [Rhodococcus sp. HNM0569]
MPVTLHTDVSPRSRVLYWWLRAAVKPVFSLWPMTDRGLGALGRIDELVDRLPRSRRVDVEKIRLGGVECERITHPRRAPEVLEDATVLYFHGGGFVFCGLATHRPLCGYLAARSGMPVVSVRYRQLPDGGIGTSTRDALAAYEALVAQCPDPAKIVVAGDSAGGYLALKVAELAAARGLPRPAAVIGYSPLLDLSFPDRRSKTVRRDAYLPIGKIRALEDKWVGGPDPIDGVHSPVDVDPMLFGPVFFSAAENEILRPGVDEMTDRLERAARPVETHVWRSQIHAFPVLGTVLRESRTVVGLSVDFVERALAAVRTTQARTADEAVAGSGDGSEVSLPQG